MDMEQTLFRAVDSSYHGPACGWEWWTPARGWAENYGSAIISRSAAGLRLLGVPLHAASAREELAAAGVVVPGGIRWAGDGIDEPEEVEIQQILAGRTSGPALAAAVRAAGYDGLIHPDHLADIGEVGTAVALVR